MCMHFDPTEMNSWRHIKSDCLKKKIQRKENAPNCTWIDPFILCSKLSKEKSSRSERWVILFLRTERTVFFFCGRPYFKWLTVQANYSNWNWNGTEHAIFFSSFSFSSVVSMKHFFFYCSPNMAKCRMKPNVIDIMAPRAYTAIDKMCDWMSVHLGSIVAVIISIWSFLWFLVFSCIFWPPAPS